ncbi:N-acetyl-gamma-glutamyl-phosphate reductase [Alloscardovia criceti]|uniref:N-acetyl-gamma-glutamyl-phosphate reductase n=1 Tax=Alloscardovia criceti TaxID=356828 RepID=UPI00036A8268|nr:Asd/ArgC dimerization domain-containing protein [Alloscardovia criceti]
MQSDETHPILSVAVVGATGYAGGEAVRILATHPYFRVTTVAGRSSVGHKFGEYAPHIPQLSELVVQDTTPEHLNGHDVVILALPHGASGKIAEQLSDVQVIVDLGADHRLESAADWDAFYGGDFYEPWVYGMPELLTSAIDAHISSDTKLTFQRNNLIGATRIAGPGCNVTATTLAFQPAISAGLVDTNITANLVVGYSGAGKNLGRINLLAAQALGSATAYAVGGKHRHIPEIKQNFTHAAGVSVDHASEFSLGFTPVLAPMSRGIFATVSAPLSDQGWALSDDDIRQVYEQVYKNQSFIHLLPQGMIPATADVVGSNSAQLQVAVDRNAGLLYAFCAIDNLNRGTAGQAIESLNIALGLPEDAGLTTIGVAP